MKRRHSQAGLGNESANAGPVPPLQSNPKEGRVSTPEPKTPPIDIEEEIKFLEFPDVPTDDEVDETEEVDTMFFSIDLDGCFLWNCRNWPEEIKKLLGECYPVPKDPAMRKKILEQLKQDNEKLFAHILAEIKKIKPKKIVILNGSNRQDSGIDEYNMLFHNSISFVFALELFTEILNENLVNNDISIKAELNKITTTDIVHQMQEGTTFDKIRAEEDGHKIGPFDKQKLIILYAQMRWVNNPKEIQNFYFYDDAIHSNFYPLYQLLSDTPWMIPDCMRMTMHEYKNGEVNQNGSLSHIDGRGSINENLLISLLYILGIHLSDLREQPEQVFNPAKPFTCVNDISQRLEVLKKLQTSGFIEEMNEHLEKLLFKEGVFRQFPPSASSAQLSLRPSS